jgi:phage tail P2-like protein
VTSVLPPNSTSTERALEAATRRVADLPVPVDLLWRPEDCPAPVLPWLAWALSVDDWQADWAEDRKRAAIAASVEIHRRKGTVWAIRRVLQVAGLGDATLIERDSDKLHDGTLTHDGTATYGLPDHWAEYKVILTRPITNAQGDRARAVLDAVAPVRCHLKALDYVEVQNLYDAAILYDDSYSHGAT